MKIIRSTKCSLKYSNKKKLTKLYSILDEYSRVVNLFIGTFWENCPHPMELKKDIVNSPISWLSSRMRKVAAREAISMVKAVKEKKVGKVRKPTHRGSSMSVSSTIARLDLDSCSFDGWLHVSSIGGNIILNLPIRRHRHFNSLSESGRRINSYIIKKDSVQFCFEVETGPKKEKDACIGVDTGINALASLSTGEQLGLDIKKAIERSKRCKAGSKGKKMAIRALRQRMDEVANEVCSKASLVVVENLKGITKNTKRRLVKNVRRSIGSWNVRYWLQRLQYTCEGMNVSFL
jgi:transposase